MRNTFIYYLTILAPIVLMAWLYHAEVMPRVGLLWIILCYTLIYRTYVDGKRLVDKNDIKNKDICLSGSG
jgi:hypothetical protein